MPLVKRIAAGFAPLRDRLLLLGANGHWRSATLLRAARGTTPYPDAYGLVRRYGEIGIDVASNNRDFQFDGFYFRLIDEAASIGLLPPFYVNAANETFDNATGNWEAEVKLVLWMGKETPQGISGQFTLLVAILAGPPRPGIWTVEPNWITGGGALVAAGICGLVVLAGRQTRIGGNTNCALLPFDAQLNLTDDLGNFQHPFSNVFNPGVRESRSVATWRDTQFFALERPGSPSYLATLDRVGVDCSFENHEIANGHFGQSQTGSFAAGDFWTPLFPQSPQASIVLGIDQDLLVKVRREFTAPVLDSMPLPQAGLVVAEDWGNGRIVHFGHTSLCTGILLRNAIDWATRGYFRNAGIVPIS